MRKLLAVLLFLALAACFSFAVAEEPGEDELPERLTSGYWVYTLREDGTAEIDEFLDETADEAVIPEELDGYRVTGVGRMAFVSLDSLERIVIPDTVTFVGGSAFYTCESLEEITFPDSVSYVESNPFDSCWNLNKIHLSPDHPYLEIVDGVLYTRPDRRLLSCLPGRDEGPFAVPDGVTEIADKAFCACSFLTGVTVPGSVKRIGDNAFAECEYMTEVTLAEGLESLGSQAFYYCPELTSVTLPDSLEYIGKNPFLRSWDLEVHVADDHPYLEVTDGVLFSRADGRLVYYPYTLPDTDYTVPDGTKIIGDLSFSAGYNITAVILPDSVTEIREDAFAYTTSLSDIFIPDSVTAIADYAFAGCEGLAVTAAPGSFAENYCLEHNIRCIGAE